MNPKNLHSALALTLAAAAITAGTTATACAQDHADAPQQDIAINNVSAGIGYNATLVDRSIVLRTDAGRLRTHGDRFEILDDTGNLAFGMPLTYQLDNKTWPIAARIDSDARTVTLTPVTNPATAIAGLGPQLTPIATQDELNAALSVAGTQIGLATAIGGMVGAALGLGIGCVAGAIVGTALMPPAFLAGAPGGCIAGAALAAGLGTAIGTIAVGAPVVVVSAIQMFNTLTNPQK
ncbi:hypothetical protein KHQ06_36560 [Nocardia tengchongensis]|uniref:DUF8020 domain-containing protein n=1 Tax=Nocardia tengchongensis TaxID=2055889 RepID=A0ABX8CN82_9NOCA|nr:hypothetical protein [Nocardia tengchongensis]QVI21408.1 hypothetical protein KHQ06_36560 [Nocardia tengchongensis]